MNKKEKKTRTWYAVTKQLLLLHYRFCKETLSSLRIIRRKFFLKNGRFHKEGIRRMIFSSCEVKKEE